MTLLPVGSGPVRISLSKPKMSVSDCQTDNSAKQTKPVIFLSLKKNQQSDDASIYHFLLNTQHPDAQKVAQLLHRVAVAQNRGTIMEEYYLSKEKIAWLGGSATRDFVQSLFAFCEDTPICRSAWKYIQNVMGSHNYARLLLKKSQSQDSARRDSFKNDPAETGTMPDYILQTDDLNTLELLRKNADLLCCFTKEKHFEKREGTKSMSYDLFIAPMKAAFVKQYCMQKLSMRLRCEYDFKTDTSTSPIPYFHLRAPQVLRHYQVEAIESTFSNERICSGLIVLPCGAGKTLTGISIAARVSKRLLILCVNTFSVYQWRDQLVRWTTVDPSRISVITSSLREQLGDIIITTYTMLTMDDDRRNDQSKELINMMLLEPFGLVLLDEVHMAAAKTFRKTVDIVRAHCFLGLTATLLREDDKIDDLDYLIGPLLYECSMYTLKKAGSIADVVCAEVHCPFPKGYLLEYMRTTSELGRRKLYNMNPTKIWCCHALIHYHETRSPPDKTLVFVDSIVMLQLCARLFQRPMIHGETSDFERDCVLSWFKNSTTVNTLFISRIGDSALDIPETNVIIQLSSLFGSQRTEVQRIGRIQRVKSVNRDAFFYSLVTPDTREIAFSQRRKQFLLSEGYGYNVFRASEIIDTVLGNGHVDGKTLTEIAPVCVGAPCWGFRTFTHDIVSVTTEDSLNIEAVVRHGGKSVNVSGVKHAIPHSDDVQMPFLSAHLSIGHLVRCGSHSGFCGEQCLATLLSYIQSECRDYIEFVASINSLALDGCFLNREKPKAIEKTVKSHTNSSSLRSVIKLSISFEKKLASERLSNKNSIAR